MCSAWMRFVVMPAPLFSHHPMNDETIGCDDDDNFRYANNTQTHSETYSQVAAVNARQQRARRLSATSPKSDKAYRTDRRPGIGTVSG